MTAQQLINAALRKVGVIAGAQSATTTQENNALEALQMLLRSWSAERIMVYYIVEGESFALTAGTSRYTIGSGGDFDTVRPVKILGAYIASGVDYVLAIIDRAKYRSIGVKTLGDVPSWLWYNPVYPLGEIYLYPTGSGTIYLASQKPLTEPSTIVSSVQFPPEYDRAITFNLAVDLASDYDKTVTRTLATLAVDSKNKITDLYASLQVEEADVEILGLNRAYSIESG